MLEIKSVSSYYGSAKAISEIDFSVEEGTVTSIVGPNGAGKSTLLDCLTGHKEYEGEILFRGDSINNFETWELAEHISYCSEEKNLFLDMSVEQNLILGGYQNREDDRIEYVYELFPRLRERKDQDAKTLSGGEQQMLAIGRSLMSGPELLILDEPSLGLAPSIIKTISEVIPDIRSQGVTMIIAEQNVNFALEHSDNIIILGSGEIRYRADTDQVTENELEEFYFGE